MTKKKYTFIDLFAGIGGFHQAMHSVGAQCVFASEWNKYARQSYKANYKAIAPEIFADNMRLFNEDIHDAIPEEIPNFDVCCAGFPCQPFSIAGHRLGFEDTRGTLFFEIMRIVKAKIDAGFPPSVLFLENVRGLKNHDKGNTLKVILAALNDLGYDCSIDVLNAKYFGVPQNRERLFIIAWYRDLIKCESFKFPYGIDSKGNPIFDKKEAMEKSIETHVSSIFEPQETMDSYYTISDRMWVGHQNRRERNRQNGKGFGYSLFSGNSAYTSTISARYWKDGSEILIDQSELGLNPRKLTPTEAGRLQGYNIKGNGWAIAPDPIITQQEEYKIVVSRKEAYQQFGNSVAVPVIKAIAKEIIKQLL